MGFAVSVIFTLSLTIASFCLPPRPPWEFLQISTSGCPAPNSTLLSSTDPMTSLASRYLQSTTMDGITIGPGYIEQEDMSGFVILDRVDK